MAGPLLLGHARRQRVRVRVADPTPLAAARRAAVQASGMTVAGPKDHISGIWYIVSVYST